MWLEILSTQMSACPKPHNIQTQAEKTQKLTKVMLAEILHAIDKFRCRYCKKHPEYKRL